MKPENIPTRTQVDQTEVGGHLVTTVRHISRNDDEVSELTGTHAPMNIEIEDRGVEHCFPERIKK